jgi:2-keto-3-deoxy-L-rhamnonate aldolase RhmA
MPERSSMLAIKINDAGKVSGTIVTDLNDLKRFVDLGMRYIVYSVDCDMLSYSYRMVKKNLEKILNG